MLVPKKENYQSMIGVRVESQKDFMARTCQNTCLGNCNAPVLLTELQ